MKVSGFDMPFGLPRFRRRGVAIRSTPPAFLSIQISGVRHDLVCLIQVLAADVIDDPVDDHLEEVVGPG